MKFSVAALLSLAASAVYAQNAGVAVNLPSIGQVLTAGTSFTITWTVDANATASSTINSIALMKGNSANLETVVPNILSAAIPVTPSSYNWNIPANIETNPSYALVLAGSNGGTTYSTYFTILNNGVAAASSGAASSAAATSGAAASGAASQSAKSSSSASASPSSTSTSGASGLKAGLVGAGAIAGAVALLL
ncbi:hypothetical protein A0J61_00768 [Choanephora cucurbitarum]|uniref:Yeast cell wall synthesis Kre9/Knh1-like N-terminal domain-containing protein n=1 Tax=Choanephora cucurbitarum TaxID=101091 RepID=A0A1C7NQ01_9FUNG|nr:hypothetical protein A0J61_00768 [Choanephora cucurbitarum]